MDIKGCYSYSDEMTEIAEAVEKAMIENSRIALDQEEYRRKNDELALKFDNAKMKYEELECKISDINNRSTNLRYFQETVESLKGQIIEFDTALCGSLVDYIIVNDDGSKIVVFRDGTQI